MYVVVFLIHEERMRSQAHADIRPLRYKAARLMAAALKLCSLLVCR